MLNSVSIPAVAAPAAAACSEHWQASCPAAWVKRVFLVSFKTHCNQSQRLKVISQPSSTLKVAARLKMQPIIQRLLTGITGDGRSQVYHTDPRDALGSVWHTDPRDTLGSVWHLCDSSI